MVVRGSGAPRTRSEVMQKRPDSARLRRAGLSGLRNVPFSSANGEGLSGLEGNLFGRSAVGIIGYKTRTAVAQRIIPQATRIRASRPLALTKAYETRTPAHLARVAGSIYEQPEIARSSPSRSGDEVPLLD